MNSMMADLGVTTHVRVWTDSNAAKAIASRRGLGKIRRVELRYLWLQDVTKSGNEQKFGESQANRIWQTT